MNSHSQRIGVAPTTEPVILPRAEPLRSIGPRHTPSGSARPTIRVRREGAFGPDQPPEALPAKMHWQTAGQGAQRVVTQARSQERRGLHIWDHVTWEIECANESVVSPA